MTTTNPHVVIVAFHAPDTLTQCLAGLAGMARITVIDNSQSHEIRAIATRANADYRAPDTNIGFGAAVNMALAQRSPGDPSDVLLVNPDAVISRDDIARLHAELRRPGNTRVCAISPRLAHPDGTTARVWWPFPSPGGAWCEALGLPRRQPTHGFAIGAVLLLRRDALMDVGIFDERFFLYAEETDWQRRALALGWHARIADDIVASHIGAGTSTNEHLRELRFAVAQEIYIRKWFGGSGWQSYRVAICVGAAIRAVLLTGARRRGAARRLRTYITGPCNRYATRSVTL
jgi:GT2 family glycosyltransferase